MYSVRLAGGGGGRRSTGLGSALGRLGRRSSSSSSSSVVPARARWTVSATPNAAAPTPSEQGVTMEKDKQQQQQQQQLRRDDAAGGQEQPQGSLGDMNKVTWDVMTHSFGEGYATRSEEEGFGGVYGRDHEVHRCHYEYDTTQGSEVKEKERARHHKGDKHGT